MEFNNTIIIIIFFAVLIIIGLIIWIIYMMIPKNTVELFGNCTHQTDCVNGLVCSRNKNNNSTQYVCLGGYQQSCGTSSDCAGELICSNSVCVNKTVTPATIINNSSPVFTTFNNMTDTNITFNTGPRYFGVQKIRPITSISQLM